MLVLIGILIGLAAGLVVGAIVGSQFAIGRKRTAAEAEIARNWPRRRMRPRPFGARPRSRRARRR